MTGSLQPDPSERLRPWIQNKVPVRLSIFERFGCVDSTLTHVADGISLPRLARATPRLRMGARQILFLK